MQEKVFKEMEQSILSLDEEKAIELAKKGVEIGIDPVAAIELGFVRGLRIVGERFANGQVFIPELFLAGRVMKRVIVLLEPAITEKELKRKSVGRVVLGTIKDDIHDLGKSLVGLMLSVNGFEVFDLGIDVPIQDFIDKAKEVNANIIGASALMTTTMLGQRDLIETLKRMGLRSKFKAMVGGAAVTTEWAKEIQADGYAEDAFTAVKVAKSLIGK